MRISILIPIYNEEKGIKKTIYTLKKVLNKNKIIKTYEIITINDASNDKSLQILKTIKDIKIINFKNNKGYSSALKAGILNTKYENIGIIDADSTYPPEEFEKIFKKFKEKNADIVIGKRDKKGVPLIRRPAKLFLKLLAEFLTGKKVQDLNSGMQVFKKELALEFFHLYPKRFSFTTTITLSSLIKDKEIYFIPIIYKKREGYSKIHPIKDTINFISLIIRIFAYFNPLKMFSALAILLFFTSFLVFILPYYYYNTIYDGAVTILFISGIQAGMLGLFLDILLKTQLMMKNEK